MDNARAHFPRTLFNKHRNRFLVLPSVSLLGGLAAWGESAARACRATSLFTLAAWVWPVPGSKRRPLLDLFPSEPASPQAGPPRQPRREVLCSKPQDGRLPPWPASPWPYLSTRRAGMAGSRESRTGSGKDTSGRHLSWEHCRSPLARAILAKKSVAKPACHLSHVACRISYLARRVLSCITGRVVSCCVVSRHAELYCVTYHRVRIVP